MIGPLEILIVLVIILLVTGAYKKLPQLGRSAGTNARIGSEKAREFADRNAPKAKELAEQVGTKGGEVGAKVNAKVGEKVDAKDVGRRAGKGFREVRDMRNSFKGMLDAPPAKKVEAEQPTEVKPKAVPAPAPKPEREPAREPVDEPGAEPQPEAAPESVAAPEASLEDEPVAIKRSDDETPA